MVQLYLVRHAIAEERGVAWPDDALRPLTADGRARMRKAAKGLAHLGMSVDVVLTSPLVRARQTAEILAAAFDGQPPVVLFEPLTPDAGQTALLDALRKHSRKPRLALVGHEPDLGALAARLIGARQPLAFKKGAVCRIDLDTLPPSSPGTLRWFVTPAILRAVSA